MSDYRDLIEHGYTEDEAAEQMDMAVVEEIERRAKARAARSFSGGYSRRGTGCDGVVYKGWVIAKRWSAPKGYHEYYATNPAVPGVEIAGGDTEWKAKQAVDRRERVSKEA